MKPWRGTPGLAEVGIDTVILVVAAWRKKHPGQEIPDGHVFTQPWPAGPTDQRRDHTFYYQYKHDRARRTLRGIDGRSPRPNGRSPGRCR